MKTPIDFDGINRAALAVARSLLPDLIPGGKFRSLEYVVKNPCRDDRTVGSFTINYKTGLWKDFASQDGGSDIVSLVAYQRNCSQGDAAQELADKLGVPLFKAPHKLSGHNGGHEPTPTAPPTIVVATDVGAPAPKVYTGGDAGPPPRPGELRRHVYYSSSGVAMRVKIKLNDGGFVNWYRVFTNGVRSGWKPKKPDDYRAIPYASAAIDPFDPELCRDEILWPEGEKDVDSLSGLNLPAFTFGGVGDGLPDRVGHYLKDRRIVILADNDEPGSEHAEKKAAMAHVAGAASIRIVHFPELPPKGDVFDFISNGGTSEQLQARIEGAPPWQPAEANDTAKQKERSELIICRASDIAPQAISWVWSRRIAIGKQTLIAGEPGLGKSQLATAIIAAVTTGGKWPGEEGYAPRGSAIILSAEDGMADTTIPRLIAAGADRERVYIVSAVRGPDQKGRRTFNLQADLALLERELERIGDVRVVVIDPVSCYMGTIDSHKNTDVRGVLEAVGEMAARHHVAVVGITHFSKGGGQKAINSFIGSIAFIAAARAAFAVMKDPEDEERRLFLPVKNNLAPMSHGLAFRIMQHIVRAPTVDTVASAISWDDIPVTSTADSVLAAHGGGDKSPTAKMECERFLEKLLADGWMSVADIAAEAIAAGHHSERKELKDNKSMRAARSALKIVTQREGFGKGAKYYWGFAGTPWRPSEPIGAQQINRAPMDAEGAHGDAEGGIQ